VSAVVQVESFYRWYLRRQAQEPEFPFRGGDAAALKRFLTPRLLSAYAPPPDVDAESDPFLQAQDSYDEWASAVSATLLQERADAALLRVTFGPPPEAPHWVDVVVRRVGDQWLLDAVLLPEESAAAHG
jgi:hypothetical protein